jgi:REP element-mobilizing transposase RayT
MHESPPGQMIRTVSEAIPERYEGVGVDDFVVMPDHNHGIIILTGAGGPSSLSLPQVVQRFKSLTTTRYRDGMMSSGWPPYHGSLWQRNYFEHVVRDEAELNRIQQYIRENALRWTLEREHPENLW